jgi:mycofactocin precursor
MLAEIEKKASTLGSEVTGTHGKSHVSPALAPQNLKEGEPPGEKPQILEEVLIEEVSIDGMCGVY